MGFYREDIIRIELENGEIYRSFMNHELGAGDSEGQRFGVRLFRNGEEVDISTASCVGYFIRPDGVTLVISGAKENGAAYVELPEAAYAVEGQFTLTIKISGDGRTGTMRIVDGTIVKTTTGAIYDPSGVVPSLEELTALIAQAEAAAETIDGISVTATQITGTRYKISVTKE